MQGSAATYMKPGPERARTRTNPRLPATGAQHPYLPTVIVGRIVFVKSHSYNSPFTVKVNISKLEDFSSRLTSNEVI